MAKIEKLNSFPDEEVKTTQTIEVRPWGICGSPEQNFYIGSGLNFTAHRNIWLEILYSVEGVNIFYTRTFLHHDGAFDDITEYRDRIDKFRAGELDTIHFGYLLPETSIALNRRTHQYEQESYSSYSLEITVDTGAVFGYSSPGSQTITIQLNDIEPESGVHFIQELTAEIDNALRGKHPNPASIPPDSSNWPFISLLNCQAYNRVAQAYHEKYFLNPKLKRLFNQWLDRLPSGGHILDIGCGHGDPVISTLLERNFRVTGLDLSAEMVRQAHTKFPNVSFLNIAINQLEAEAEFDGACSLSSLLYLDPIDLLHGIYRLYHAIKPGGLLFLFGYDSHPNWRGYPFDRDLGQPMWSWRYSIDEATQHLEEHGYFKVLKAQDVTTPNEKKIFLADWEKNHPKESKPSEMETEKPNWEINAEGHTFRIPDFPVQPHILPYCYAIIARRTT